jgi:hypothetical protein
MLIQNLNLAYDLSFPRPGRFNGTTYVVLDSPESNTFPSFLRGEIPFQLWIFLYFNG